MLLIMFFFTSFILILLILYLFLLASKKMNWEIQSSMSFECGYSSYFLSRFSFSMHYYLIGLIFLFLDLELCLLMPFFNEDFSIFKLSMYSWIFVLILILSIIQEWKTGKLDWKS